jgi:hypothetical protein
VNFMSQAATPSADDIQRQMREVRAELRDDVQEIVDNARVLTDWQHYVRQYPWLCLGAAAAVGYLVVPQRVHVIKPDSKAIADMIRQHQVSVKTEIKPQPSPGLVGGLVNMAAGMAVQGLLAVASAQLNQFLQQMTDQPGRGETRNEAGGATEVRGGSGDEKPHR